MISCTASMKNIAKISSYYVLPIKLYFIVFLISPLEVKLSIYDALTLLIRYIYLCTHHSKANLGAEPDANLDPSLRRGNLSIKHSTWDQARSTPEDRKEPEVRPDPSVPPPLSLSLSLSKLPCDSSAMAATRIHQVFPAFLPLSLQFSQTHRKLELMDTRYDRKFSSVMPKWAKTVHYGARAALKRPGLCELMVFWSFFFFFFFFTILLSAALV